MKKSLLFIFFLFLFYAQAQKPGDVDTSFNSADLGFGFGDGANDYVKDVMIQPDGKIIIGGDFTIYNTNTAKSLARINSDGSFDNTFLIGSGANDYVSSFVAQPDGKLIVCGSFTNFNGVSKNRIVRLNPNGSTDTSFVIGTGADGVIECVVVQPDGKIIIGGQFTKYNGVNRKYLARLNVDGSLDTNFDTSAGFNSHVYSLAIQPDGKILAGGNFTLYNSVTKNYLVRLNSDASIDETFVNTGANNIVYKILLSNDGKIFLGGKFTKYNNVTKNSILKLNEDGSIDESFNIGSGANNVVRNILILSNNKVLLGGDFTAYNGMVRSYVAIVNENGSIDASFIPSKGFGASVTSFQQQSDGKLVVGGSYTNFNNNIERYITRVNFDGSLDNSFNPGNGADGNIRAVATQSDKKMIIAGNFNSFNDNLNSRLARIDTDGNIDTSLQVPIGTDQLIRTVAVQNDDKILIGGDFLTFNNLQKSYLARLTSTGSLDASFSIGYGPTEPVREILIQPDGKILICGDFTVFNTKTANRIIRLNPDGTIDSSFLPVSGSNGNVYTMKLQSDNKIIIAGTFTTYDGVARNRIARLNPDGTLDTTFTIGTGANNTISSLLIQEDGKIIIGGNFTTFAGVSSNRIARLNTNGSRDTTFTSGAGANASVETLTLEANGKILIGGSFTKFNNINRNYIARLTKDGALDDTFNKIESGANKAVYKIINQDDKFIAVGDFTSYNGVGRNRITRIFGGEEEHLATNNDISKVKIYPNPTSDKLFISSSLDLIKYEIYDFTGQKLVDKSFDNRNKSIEVNYLKKGIYILKLIDKNQKVQTVKFLIE
ncbi:T9SS type A sorting domain-containing protein [Epilithonimonas arachidiradicis]|uniref:Putative delta-60 repeat protein/predicted secreted protein (Por secretion system target) n=1 Tax=Epilithonimonas arachidiradicis TaxID=1617282 RepID=A0A420CN07_9FLAO|nr:T9SS type A sorting domain-containing protein [Epilithonimonas arachidiradicis]RKE79788.1 putative delta-60 repeat protein/predicted secreted protein (Por secretion system target) [Epilithonimonas arachidiradicis]GGG51731.1 hypothetical protein GCM10007332_11780 [Epilithonimonas arachidiradicis]